MHLPTVKHTFLDDKGRFFILTNDIGHRRVTTVAGRVGKRGRRTVRVFEDRATLREFVDRKIEAREAKGFMPFEA
jgi:predicted DNA-binding WGR domain protein